jgi:hypothetical protein
VTVEKVREMPEKANPVLDVEIKKPKVKEKKSLHRCKEKESNNNVKQEGRMEMQMKKWWRVKWQRMSLNMRKMVQKM